MRYVNECESCKGKLMALANIPELNVN